MDETQYDEGGRRLPREVGSITCRLTKPVLTPAQIDAIKREAGGGLTYGGQGDDELRRLA